MLKLLFLKSITTGRTFQVNFYYCCRKLATLRKIYEKFRDKNDVSINLKVISNGYAGTPKSFLLTTRSNNYIFNPGENTQRIMDETKLKFKNIKHVFITQKSWDCFGGLVEILKLPGVVFHSPFRFDDVSYVSDINRQFIHMNRKQHDYDREKTFSDDLFNIKAVEIGSCSGNRIYSYIVSWTKKLATDNYENDSKKHGAPFSISELLQEELKKGNDISDLSTIKNLQEKPIKTDVRLLVIDIPNENFIETVEINADLNDPSINIIVHLSSTNVLNNKRYQDWIKSKLNVKHLILDEKQENIELLKMRSLQKTLNLIDDQIFPVFPKFEVEDVVNRIQHENVFYGKTKSRIEFRTLPVFIQNEHLQFDENRFLKGLRRFSGEPYIEKILSDFRDKIKLSRSKQKKLDPYPKVTFLGTGSASPSPTRSTSSILVSINENTNLLLDCGEGTIGQMKRLFGKERFKSEIKKLKAVYISHRHTDHHLGLFSILIERKRIFEDLNEVSNEDFYLCVPYNVDKYLEMYANYDKDVFKSCRIIKNDSLDMDNNRDSKLSFKNYDDLLQSLNLSFIQTVPVDHVRYSTGLILKTQLKGESPPFKLVFSGDCKPTKLLAKYGENCDLLIHEATFDESYKSEALLKNHSTTLQAIDIGKKMKAKKVILWHFSQRYGIVPLINDISKTGLLNVSISFDNMCVNRNDLEILPQFNEIFQTVFSEYHDEVLHKSKNKIIGNYEGERSDEED